MTKEGGDMQYVLVLYTPEATTPSDDSIEVVARMLNAEFANTLDNDFSGWYVRPLSEVIAC